MKKILILSANPINTGRLRLDQEVREIQNGLERAKSREKFEIITKWAVRPDDLRRALLDHEPEIVHFSGHGGGNQGLANALDLKGIVGAKISMFKIIKNDNNSEHQNLHLTDLVVKQELKN